MNTVIISDPSLRDGNHSVKHTINLESIEKYCIFAENANIPIVEVGHGNGLGASSILIGQSLHSDQDVLKTARKYLSKTKLSVHSIPGISTIKDDIQPAIEYGVDIFRIATHCTEATLSKTHIEYIKNKNIEVQGVLMMSALISAKELLEQAFIMQSYGAEAIIIMDSTGTYMPKDIQERISLII
jgi:4-hydroxy 2-oxovalerate aldolase